MAKFCPKCGKPLKEGAKFCPACGAQIGTAGNKENQTVDSQRGGNEKKAAQSYGQPQGTARIPKKPKRTSLFFAACIAAAGILIAVLFMVFMPKGYEKPLEYFEKGFNERNVELLRKAFADETYVMDLMDMLDSYSDAEVKMEIEVGDAEKLDKEDMKVLLVEKYYLPLEQAVSAQKAYVVNAEISTKDSDGKRYSERIEIPVIKIDGSWKIPSYQLYDFLYS